MLQHNVQRSAPANGGAWTQIDDVSEEEAGSDAGWGPLDGLPGNPMLWILILGELAVIGTLLVGFSVAKVLQPEALGDGLSHLHQALGGINTAVSITSGWLAAMVKSVP